MTTDNILQAVRDPERLATLQNLDLLDTEAEEAFDRLTELASLIIGTPISLVSLVDADRQFFKSLIGLKPPLSEERETPLSHSFCKHVVATGDPLVINDARNHPELKDNLAIPDLGVIGYLGMPLQMEDGTSLGSFCVIDTEPHDWSEQDIQIMRELAELVMTEIQLRSEIKARQQIEDALTQKNRQYRRAYRFAKTTLNHMEDILKLGSSKNELLTYVKQMKNQLSNL